MLKPSIVRTARDTYPKGTILTWEGDCTNAAPAPLQFCHSPTVVVAEDPPVAVYFEGSLDGEKFAVLRDKDGEVVRITRSGSYRLPVAVCYLRPVCAGDVFIQTFIQG